MKKYFVSISLSLVLLSGASAQTVTDGLVGYWPFNGNSNDQIGSSDLSNNGASLTSDRLGNPNAAYEFDGSASLFSDGTYWNTIQSGNAYTISLWFKANSIGGDVRLLSQCSDNFTDIVNIGIKSGELNYSYYDGTPLAKSTSFNDINEWHNIVATNDGVGNISAFLDGEEMTGSLYGGSSLGFLKIGSASQGNTTFFNGKIDDIAIYDRVLSMVEINLLANDWGIAATPTSWTNQIDINTSGNTLTKTTSSNAYNSGALSVEVLNEEVDGWVQATVPVDGTKGIIGLSFDNNSTAYAEVDYGLLYKEDGQLMVFEQGEDQGTVGTYAAGDVIKVERIGDLINYYNGTQLLRSAYAFNGYVLHADVLLFTGNSSLSNIAFSPSFAAESAAPVNTPNVLWENVEGSVRMKDGNIWKTGDDNNWNKGGGISKLSLNPNTDGWVEFTAGANNYNRMMGLALKNTGTIYSSIHYALYLKKNGSVGIHKSDVSLGEFGSYEPDDVFRVERVGSQIIFKKGTQTLYSEETLPQFQLHADFSMGDEGAVFKNVSLSPSFDAVVATSNSGTTNQWTYITSVYAENDLMFSDQELIDWTGSAISQENISVFENGSASFTAAGIVGRRMFGLAQQNNVASYTSIDYAIFLDQNGNVKIYESGTKVGDYGSYVNGDTFKVERVGSTIQYWRNTDLLESTTTDASLQLHADIAFRDRGAALDNITLSESFNLDSEETAGLMAYYPLDGTTTDFSGNGFTGTPVGITGVEDRFGNTNGAVYFNGNSYISTSVILDQNATKFTISGWIKLESLNSDGQNNIFTQGTLASGSNTNHQVRIHSDQKLHLDEWQPDNGWIESAGTIQINEWTHFAVVVDGLNRKIYLNGLLSSEDNSAETYSDQAVDIATIGSRYKDGAPDQFFNGSMDDIYIYNTALSQQEVVNLMGGSGISNPGSGGGYWTKTDNDISYGDGRVFIGNNSYTDTNYNLFVEKGILTEKVKVQLTTEWADYVFEDDYVLIPIEELEAFLKKEKHLPNVPSANEVAEQGIDVEEMNIKLLEKIEELTLYIIEMNKKMESQQKEIDALKEK